MPPSVARWSVWTRALSATGVVAVAVISLWALRTRYPPPSGTPPPVSAPVPVTPTSYVDNERCLECHQAEGAEWARSHHAQAMARATAETVRGDFDDATLEHQGVTSRFFRRDGTFYVHTDGPDGKLADFEIKYTFGVDPLQQYLIELPGGRLQALTLAWDTARKRWFPLFPDEKAPPGDVLHWTGRYQNWNMMCASCHSTNLVKGYDTAADAYRTSWSEVNVTCQSCHGPGERHVAWARERIAGRTPPATSGERYGLVMDFAARDAAAEVDVCAACHARRSELTAAPVPGQPLLDNYLPALLRDELYHPDGQQLGEVYVYGSFRQSKMYQRGVRCTDCHDPHTAGLKAEGNALCTQCHQPQANPRFPSAAGRYDDPAHYHHEPGTPGAQCVGCHMPAKNYMIVDPRQDHSLRIPRPDLSVKMGTPNACTSCHADKPAQWAADAVAKWYGDQRTPEAHYGEALAAGRSGRPGAAAALTKLVEDASKPAIVRATALDLLRRYGPEGLATRIAATRDADPAVRAAAADGLEQVPAVQRLSAVSPLLSDPIRAVRIAAARVLSSVPPAALDVAQRAALDAALAEFVAAQNVSLDQPGAHLNLAVVCESTGRTELAEKHYGTALRLDPDFTPARANLAQLYSRTSRAADAERVLRAGLERVPTQGDLQYMLGLLLAEEQRLPEAANALGKAATLLPERARVRYNHGLALQGLDRRKEAEAEFIEAQRIDPRDPGIVNALAIFYTQDGRWAEAVPWAKKLEELRPGDPEVQQLVQRILANAPGAAGR